MGKAIILAALAQLRVMAALGVSQCAQVAHPPVATVAVRRTPNRSLSAQLEHLAGKASKSVCSRDVSETCIKHLRTRFLNVGAEIGA
jgi:hypothetical protein